jgi:Mn2+/Fe2+ NRAMP family transporter
MDPVAGPRGVLIGNTIEAAADIGGMAAAVQLFLPIHIGWIVAATGLSILGLQIWGSYELIRTIFRYLALILLAYVGAAILAKPDWREVLSGTLIPRIHFSEEYLSLLVAIIGTTLSAYLYTWQSNVEVEEEISKGRTELIQRRGATKQELRRSRGDILWGMLFSNLIMYFIILSTGATLYEVGEHDISTAAQAAAALKPIAGDLAGVLFALGVIAVGFLAVPIMTAGAAYDLAQALGWKHSLHAKPREARRFYIAISGFTFIAIALNFLGFNPMRALVWSGIVQGFSTPPLLLLIMLITNNRRIMGEHVNGGWMNALGWTTTVAIFAASCGLIATWLI